MTALRDTPRPRRLLAGATVAVTMLAGLGASALAPLAANASSHREAPLIAGDPRADNTDVYAFVSPDRPDTVTLLADWIPFEEPNGGPNFYAFAENTHYDVNIDSNGDAKADLTYRWTFTDHYKSKDTILYNTGVVTKLTDPTLNFTQTYNLDKISYSSTGAATTTRVLTDAAVAPSDVGPASMPDYASLRDQAITTIGSNGKSFAGQADDPFFLDLRVFDLLYGANLKETGHDTLAGYNVNTIGLQVPKSDLALNGNATGNPVIGVWSDTERQSVRVIAPTDTKVGGATQTESGDYAQVSRLGNPLVNEVVIPLKDKDNFNNSTPQHDGQFLPYVQSPEVPKLIESIYGIKAPATPRSDLVEVFLTGVCKACGPVGAALGDLNSQQLNKDVDAAKFAPAEELRLNMSVAPTYKPNRMGVLGGDLAGYPNGRRLADDVIDIDLQALEGALPPYNNKSVGTLGDGVNVNDETFHASFPYVALPHDNSVNKPGDSFETARLYGADRYGTAASIATHTFGSANTVLLASGEDKHYPDALTANYLAGQKYAPVLLTTGTALPSATTKALKELNAKSVIIIGGTAAVSAGQEASLKDNGYSVTRLGGATRYDTAKAVAAAPGVGYVANHTAILASGQNWPDALVGGALGFHSRFPIEITASSSLTAQTKASLSDLGITKVLLLGGTSAVSDSVAKQLTAMHIAYTRLSGSTRADTAVAVANYALANLGFTNSNVNVSRGTMGADALSGGPNAGVDASPLLLTLNSTTIGTATLNFIKAHASTLNQAHVYGGPVAVSNAILAQITSNG